MDILLERLRQGDGGEQEAEVLLPRRHERRHDGEDDRQGRLPRTEGVPRQADRDS